MTGFKFVNHLSTLMQNTDLEIHFPWCFSGFIKCKDGHLSDRKIPLAIFIRVVSHKSQIQFRQPVLCSFYAIMCIQEGNYLGIGFFQIRGCIKYAKYLTQVQSDYPAQSSRILSAQYCGLMNHKTTCRLDCRITVCAV